MNEMSNRTLALLLVGAIVISLAGTFISLSKLSRISGLTGLAVDTDENATVTLNILSRTEVNWTVFEINWGSGYVDSGYSGCNLSTHGLNGSRTGIYSTEGDGCDTDSFNSTARSGDTTSGLVLENVGNKNVTLNITSTKNAAEFIGGTDPIYWFNVTDNTAMGGETYSCMNVDIDADDYGLGLLADAYTNMAGNYTTMSNFGSDAGIGTAICNATAGGFNFEDYADKIRIDIFVRIPADAASGAHTDTITAIVEAI